MESQRLCTGVVWALLLSIAFGVSQTKAESHESLSKKSTKAARVFY